MSFLYAGNSKQVDDAANFIGIDDSQVKADTFQGFGSSLFEAPLRAGAEVGRAGALALSTIPVAYDLLNGGNEAQDWYFKNVLDDKFNEAVDYWTPSPHEVGFAGQLASGIGTGLSQLAVGMGNPSLLIASQQLGTGLDLVRQGVDAETAQGVGLVSGAATAVGAWLPVFGTSLAAKIGIGAATNTAIGVAQRGASGAILDSHGYNDAADNYNAWDANAIITDAVMGAAFGYIGRDQNVSNITESIIGTKATNAIDESVDSVVRSFLSKDRLNHSDIDTAASMGNVKSYLYDTAPGRPINDEAMLAHEVSIRSAVNSLLTDSPVDVSNSFNGTEQFEFKGIDDASREAYTQALNDLNMKPEEPVAVVTENKPLPMVDLQRGEFPTYSVAEAASVIENTKDLNIETDSGQKIPARNMLESAVMEHRSAVELEKGFKAAALCIMGG